MASVVSKPRGDTSMQAQHRDLMSSGTGTPWEDRGQLGLVTAYVATVKKAMTAPTELLGELRRPNSAGDATSFAMICGAMWGIGELVHTWILARSFHSESGDPSPWLRGIILAVAAPFAAVLVARLAAIVFGKLISSEIRASDAPTVLLFNIFAYCLAPSVLAIIPFVGPAIAAIWIIALMMVAAIKRLRLKTGGAIVNVILTSIVCSVSATVLVYGVKFLSGTLWKSYYG